MILQATGFHDVHLIHSTELYDERGFLFKTFNKNTFKRLGLETNFRECYYTYSKKDVLRGMHFQLPPHDHVKLVHVIQGKILDVVVDVRVTSKAFGEYLAIELFEQENILYIEKGFAHGFLALTDQCIVAYMTSTVYHSSHDTGILWNSFGFDWEGIKEPVISERDQNFKSLQEYAIEQSNSKNSNRK